MRKIEMDIFLGDQDRWIIAVNFMDAVDNFYGPNSNIKSLFIIDSLTGIEKFRLP